MHTIQLAPLVTRLYGGKILPIYLARPARFASRRPVDLVVIDGPATELGGREGTLYQAHEWSRPGTVVLLDDANRVYERDVLERWRANLGDAVEISVVEEFRRGLGVVVVREPVRPQDLWNRRVQLTFADIGALVPAGEVIAVADEGWWGQEIASGRTVVPLWSPVDDAAAIAEVERLRRSGATFAVFAWPSFSWFKYFAVFRSFLHSTFRCLLDNDRLVVFELASP